MVPASPTMAIGLWLQRCTPGVSSLMIILLLAFSERFFIFYTIFLHVVISAIPLRIFRGARLATNQIRTAIEICQGLSDKPLVSRGSSYQGAPLEATHVSIIPSYKESIETLQDTLRILASHRLAKSTYDVRKSPYAPQGIQSGC